MGWLSSLFSSLDSSQRSRRRQELSATHAAFSLPTSSPVFGTHSDAYASSSLQTPDPEGARSPTYTYPPQGMAAYGNLPSPLTSRHGSASLLPTHMDPFNAPLSPQHRYPPLSTTWNRLRSWLNREYPELGDTLNYGILPQDLANIELQFGFPLPQPVRESYLCVDGQEAESAAGCAQGLFFGLTFLPLESALEEWRFWREVDEDSSTGANPRLLELMQSIPPGWIRKDYSNRGWVPLIADKAGNYIGIDLNPAEQGSVGQVIIFGRDFDTKVVLWNGDGPGGWAKWLAAFAEELEAGEGFEIGNNDNSEGSEDDIGYENYYHDGSGRGAGDSGGDSGAGGGLKLTGDYRGWSVLEAWGDRSLRKWHEAGLLPQYAMQNESAALGHKTSDSIGLGVVELKHEASAEVAIPVIAENETVPPPPPPVTIHISHPSVSSTRHGPSYSVSKAPAPRPVDLPTASDISPPESTHGNDDDLEAGQSHAMREFRDDSNLVTSKPRPYAPVRSETSDAVNGTSALSMSPPLPALPSSPPTQAPIAPLVPDLMEESTSKIDTIPLQPSTSTSARESKAPIANGTSSPETKSVEDPADLPEVGSPVPGIRLVGGDNAVVGVVENAEAAPSTTEATPVPEAVEPATVEDGTTSAAETAPAATVSKAKHKKNRSSIASLKKLGIKSKRDSSSSAKDAVASSQ